ncbi:hypothetical protein A3A78_01180 [candidate division WWE3 bacterium RIFCSPLOWO2_01_FULL_41_18]|uniref:Uncharacterized protein n=1 Tax=candidate division WWE3 bacterium RIFCSPLOWO2_01_FULL_41_18 TaxID=1802625 RepID=A0A1F4VE88_UNCKA|nr:MAG: hypothetical protein A3A78_01180 [candidate division WWE3 bacterium RIFCSPLOWO2_01_FULL_41_18]
MTKFSFHLALPADVVVPATLDFGQNFLAQVQKILESAGPGLRTAGEVALPGQAVAAILATAGLEMVSGLPTLTLYSIGQKAERVGVLDLGGYRHQAVRSRRGDVPQGEAFLGYTVLDGSGRGMSAGQLGELAQILDVAVEEIRAIDANVGQIDWADPTKGMVDRLIATGLTKADWASRRVLSLPAGAGLAAALQAATIHGLSESWPRTIRLASGADKAFHVGEIVDPQDMRLWGTNMTAKWQSDATAGTLRQLASELGTYGVSVEAGEGTISVAFPGGQVFRLAITSATCETKA